MNAEPSWQGATFADAALTALREGERLSLADKIRWIEEAEEFGLQFQRRRWRAGLGVDPRFQAQLEFEDRRPRATPSAAPAPAPFRPPAWFTFLEA
ncbi:MAG: hypothetical protein JSR82_00705 [Verrucomicrobia bacterium]|nr:hypothetical protein [Verrucomicrobiota bacterium]